MLCKDQPRAHQLGVLSREEQAFSFILVSMWPSTWGAVWVGATNQSLAAPQPLVLSPDVTSPDIWLSGLIELMLGGSWQARKPNYTHILAHPAKIIRRHCLPPQGRELTPLCLDFLKCKMGS